MNTTTQCAAEPPVWPRGAAQVAQAAQRALDAVGIQRNPYFESLESGRLTLDDFAASQEQFFHAVVEFSRPMSVLMARLDDPLDRLGLLDNIVEEHGHFDRRRFHATTFRELCTSLREAGAKSPGNCSPGPAVAAFNWTLWGVCQSGPVDLALACLGTIEWAFASISARLGQAIVARGWVPIERLAHYRLHAELDIEHAGQLFRPLEARWNDPSVRAAALSGLELGAFAFDRLYRELDGLQGAN